MKTIIMNEEQNTRLHKDLKSTLGDIWGDEAKMMEKLESMSENWQPYVRSISLESLTGNQASIRVINSSGNSFSLSVKYCPKGKVGGPPHVDID